MPHDSARARPTRLAVSLFAPWVTDFPAKRLFPPVRSRCEGAQASGPSSSSRGRSVCATSVPERRCASAGRESNRIAFGSPRLPVAPSPRLRLTGRRGDGGTGGIEREGTLLGTLLLRQKP